jgi:TATA-box binding protein (TBP) (component of TFIID and TFIIIB)
MLLRCAVVMTYCIDVVNCNYRSTVGKPLNLSVLHASIPNSKLCTKPKQLVIKDPQGTLLFFSNGKLRVMGCNDELEATFLAYKYVQLIDKSDDFHNVFAQSSTVRVTFHKKIHLQKLVHSTLISGCLMQHEPELFPAVLIRKYKPLSVNVFSSGKIMICGVKDVDQVHNIMKDLCVVLENFTL